MVDFTTIKVARRESGWPHVVATGAAGDVRALARSKRCNNSLKELTGLASVQPIGYEAYTVLLS